MSDSPGSNPLKGNNPGNLPKGLKPKINPYWIYGLVLLAILGVQFIHFGQSAKEVDMNRFENEMLKPGDVEKIVIVKYKETANIFIRADRLNDPKFKDLQEKGLWSVP